MSTQSFEPLELNSPVDSILTSSVCSTEFSDINSEHNKILYTNNQLTNNNNNYNNNINNNNYRLRNNNNNSNLNNSFNKIDIGWLNFSPKFLNYFMNAKWALFWLCWGSALQGILVNGFINIVITTIERRFGLRSSQTGLVASGYDIASFICLAPVTYFGGRYSASKPRWVAWGVAIMGMGSFVFSLPHFLVGNYKAAGAESHVCTQGNITATGCSLTADTNYIDGNENLTWTVWIFFLAQLLNGVGASPLFTLGVTYIDENVSKKMSSVYLGIYYTMAIIGPALGYVMGGQLLQIYTDVFTVDPITLGLTPRSKVWVGAWWIPFIFTGVLCMLLAIPIAAYPKSLPGAENIEKISEAHGNSATNQNFTKLKEMPKAFCALFKNPTFCFLNLASATEGMIIAGFAAFLPKFIENQYSVNAVWASLLMGAITVPAGGGGTFLGGYLVKKYDLQCTGIIKLCLYSTIVAACFTISFYLSCPNLKFAGVTTGYNTLGGNNTTISISNFERAQTIDFELNLEANCNSKCKCSRSNYEPICGNDGFMYYSPCHAGCSKETSLEKTKVYNDCVCIGNSNQTKVDDEYEAENTICQTDCTNIWIFSFLCFFQMLFTFLASMPALSGTLRCVQEQQRSFALGIQWIKVRLLGTIPAPMIFGFLIDASCILWQDSCDGSGACLVYDNKSMSWYMMSLALIGKSCSVVFFFLAWFYYIPPKCVTDGESNSGYHIESQQQQQQHKPEEKY